MKRKEQSYKAHVSKILEHKTVRPLGIIKVAKIVSLTAYTIKDRLSSTLSKNSSINTSKTSTR